MTAFICLGCRNMVADEVRTLEFVRRFVARGYRCDDCCDLPGSGSDPGPDYDIREERVTWDEEINGWPPKWRSP